MLFNWLKGLFPKSYSRSTRRRNNRTKQLQSSALESRKLLTMTAQINLAGTAAASQVEIRDFNNDGLNDIAELNSGTGSVGVRLGNGDGTFQSAISSLSGGNGTKMAISDFNHDGNLDIVAVQGYNVDLLKGKGDGSFQAPIPYYASAYPNDIDVGDVNNDGFDDIFTASFSYGGTTQIFINDGMGSFLPSHNQAIGPTGWQIEGGDINGDGYLDLVQSNGAGNIGVLIGRGDGQYLTINYVNTGISTQDLEVEDFNGDGRDDLVVTNGSQVTVYAGDTAASFQSPTTYAMVGATRLDSGDINGDGNQDIVGNNGMVLLGRGSGGFYAPTAYGAATGNSIAVGDLDGDGGLDTIAGATLGGVNLAMNAKNDVQLLAGATHVSVSTSGSAVAGTPFSITVTALDADGNVVTGFQGTVGILGAPGTKPTTYTFTAADNGVHTIDAAATLFTAGSGTYTVTAPFLPDATGTVEVVAGAAAKFKAVAQTSTVAGTEASVTITSYDAYGNFASNYLGAVHFTSTDLQAGLPADYTFTAEDAGTHTFAVTLKTAGLRTVSVADTLNAASRSTSNAIAVTANTAASLIVTGGGGYVGSVNAVTVRAIDAYGNAATSYNGVIHLSSSDSGSTTSADAALVNGVGTFTVTPTTMGTQTLTATDVATGAIVGSETINVTPGWGARFTATALNTNVTAGQTQTTTLTVYDAYSNVSTVYTGWVIVRSADDPRVYSYVNFTAADAGVKQIPVTLFKAGVQSVTISDLYNPGVTTTQLGINVAPAAAVGISVTPIQSTVAGVAQSVTVIGRDAYGNVAPDYRGTVTFTSTDTLASLPADYTFTEADAGSHTFSLTMKTASNQDVTVQDTTTQVVLGYYQTNPYIYFQQNILVTPAELSTFTFKGASSSNVEAGSAVDLTVSATDAFGNTITDYTGTVLLSSTDSQSNLPVSYTFTGADAGEHVFSVVLKTAGSQTITLTDSANSAVAASQTTTVRAGVASKFLISTPTTTDSGISQNVTVSASDAYGNAVTSYVGTVKFTSSDASAILPANYTFGNKDKGVHTFAVTLKTVGTQSLTVSDTLNAALAGTQAGITVKASVAPVASFSVTGFPATTAGATKTFVVTAKDAKGAIVTGYTGTVNFSSSDVKAGLPASYTFTAADAGVHTFSATLKTTGSQSITVKDSALGTVVGSQTGIVVAAGVATQFVASAPTTAASGVSVNVTLTVYDAYGNIATNYTGKVHVSSTDAKGSVTDYTFSTKDAGVHVFSYKFGTLGTQTLTLADTSNSLLFSKSTFSVLAK